MNDFILLPGDVIKHKNSLDVCCVVRSFDGIQAAVDWVNLGEVKSWLIGQSGVVEITEDWLVCTTYRPVCYRHCSWREL